MNLMNNSQMDRGNALMIEKNHEKTQSGSSVPWYEPGTSRMQVSCVTTEPPRSVIAFIVYSQKKVGILVVYHTLLHVGLLKSYSSSTVFYLVIATVKFV